MFSFSLKKCWVFWCWRGVYRLLTNFPIDPQMKLRISLFATASSKHISASVSKFALVDEKDKANNQAPKIIPPVLECT